MNTIYERTVYDIVSVWPNAEKEHRILVRSLEEAMLYVEQTYKFSEAMRMNVELKQVFQGYYVNEEEILDNMVSPEDVPLDNMKWQTKNDVSEFIDKVNKKPFEMKIIRRLIEENITL